MKRLPSPWCTLAGLLLIEVSAASDWETSVAREAVGSHESLDVYRPYCRTLGLPENRNDWGEGPWASSFCSVNRFSSSSTDFDEVDDIRDLTSEALFAASESRLNRAPTDAELKGMVREKDKYETFNILKLNPSKFLHLPAVELFFKYRELDATQITHFYAPNEFNDVTLNEYGLGLSKRFPVTDTSEITLRGGYRRIEREGTVEFLPEATDDIDHLEAGARWDWVHGEQKDHGRYEKEAGLSLYYFYQDIQPDIPNADVRDRDLFAARARYKTDLAGSGLVSAVEVFAGVALDDERYGSVAVSRNDYFAGITGFRPSRGGYWALTLQSAFFTSQVSNDVWQDNSQFRTSVVMARYFYTDVDDWWALVFPLRKDAMHEGPDVFENYKVGAEIQWKRQTLGSGHLRWFFALGYDGQHFYNVDKFIHGVSATMSASF